MKDLINNYLENSIKAKQTIIDTQIPNIEKCAQKIIDSIKSGGKILIFGNGGSAADAQHFAAELVGRYKMERKAYPAIALTTNTSSITAIGNDYGYEDVFVRQVQALVSEKDVVFGISTSGKSPNVIKALDYAKENGVFTVLLMGEKIKIVTSPEETAPRDDTMPVIASERSECGNLRTCDNNDKADICLSVPVSDTPFIQEGHITIIHILCMLVEIGLTSDV